ncbi:Membrane protein involved in the export of O-antigen and teichoic acid [Candidatus Methanophagaceae archaeon]|nr:Membrane protein involved in the export of O-antigen and teichoic acid [Methanophagales archaeon]
MSTVQRVARNTGIIMVGDLIFRLISLVVIIYLARYLGTAEFGKYSFVFAYLAFFGVITDLGLQQILVREMSRDPSAAPKLIGNAYFIRLILTVFAVVLSMIVISFMSYPKDTTTYIYIATITLLFISFSDFYATIFQANLKMEYREIAKLAFKIISAVLIFWIIFSHGTLMQVMLVLVFSEMVKTLVSYLFSRKLVRPRFEIDFVLWKYLFKEAFPIALSSVIWIIYFRIDVVMLSIMQGDTPVGIYSAAYTLSEPLYLIPYAVTVSLFPIMSASFKSSKERLMNVCKPGIRYLLIITLPIAIGTTLIADKIIFLIYGADFSGSATALQILIWTLVFSSINIVLLNLLTSVGKQKLNTLSSALCAVINVCLNFILIPIISYNGAAIATVATNVVLFIACFYFVSKHLQVFPVHKIAIKPIISGLLMGAFVCYFTDVSIFLLVPFSVAVYLAALLALKTFTKEDWDMIRKIVSRR